MKCRRLDFKVAMPQIVMSITNRIIEYQTFELSVARIISSTYNCLTRLMHLRATRSLYFRDTKLTHAAAAAAVVSGRVALVVRGARRRQTPIDMRSYISNNYMGGSSNT